MILLILLLETGLAFLGGWFLMLAIGVMHHDWVPGLPTIGYLTSVLVVLLLRLTFTDYGLKDVWDK